MTDIFTQRLLLPDAIDIRENGEGLLLVHNGREMPIDQVVRCFPFSTPDQWLSLRNADGDELGLLESLDGLAPDARLRLETRLKDRYHMPVIAHIDRIENGDRGTVWHVHTEDGPETFTLRGDRGIDFSAFPRIYLTDGQTRRRFVIPDFTALPGADQKRARAHLPMGFRGGGFRGRGGGFR